MFPIAVIDSGPLFDALLLNYDMPRASLGRQLRFRPELDYELQSKNAQRQFLELLASIPRKLTTSHVIAELHGLEKRSLGLHGPVLRDFWNTSIDLLMQWRIDETLVRLLDLASNDSLRICLPRIEVTDTGLIDLAKRNNCVLITRDERTLAREAYIQQVDCRLVKRLIPLV
jgi:hypothetical protein